MPLELAGARKQTKTMDDQRTDTCSGRGLIALYGSLQRGQPPHQTLGVDRLLRYAGPCTLAGALYDFGDWPGLVAGPGTVAAELYEIAADDALARLDAYEACNLATRGAACSCARR